MNILCSTSYPSVPGFRHRVVLMAALMVLALGARGSANTSSLASSAASSQSVSGAAVPAYRQANRVAILTIHGVIDGVTLTSIERRMKQALADGAEAVVLDINTPGGEMFSTLEICALLKNRSEAPANVVAWIHPTAYSAGTIIALAAREIVVAPGSTMGDAAPIDIFGRQMNPTERAKFLSPLLTEIIDSARRHHYDEKLVQAFVMLGQELWMIENIATKERVFVDRAEYQTVFGEDPPTNITPVTPSAAAVITGRASDLRPLINQTIPRTSDLAAMDPQMQQQQVEYEKVLPPARQSLTAADRSTWRLLMQVTDGTTLLTIKPDEAVYYGLASAVIANDADVQTFFGAQSVTRYDQTWSEGLVRFLVSLPVRIVLIIVFLICLFVELAMPGFGVFGTAAIVAILILIGAPALAGLAQWWDILLIGAGLLLVLAELFLIPGTGLAGVGGAVCLLVGLVGTFISGDVSSPQGQNQLWTGVAATFTAVFVSGVAMWFISRQLHSFPIINRLILHTELKDPDADAMAVAGTAGGASVGLLEAMGPRRESQRALQQGDLGVAETDLRPAGRAMFNGRMIDVKSVGNYIAKGTPVRILSVGRFVIEVEEQSS